MQSLKNHPLCTLATYQTRALMQLSVLSAMRTEKVREKKLLFSIIFKNSYNPHIPMGF
jgi:hypothetical protein